MTLSILALSKYPSLRKRKVHTAQDQAPPNKLRFGFLLSRKLSGVDCVFTDYLERKERR
jgi:hypothetical protein